MAPWLEFQVFFSHRDYKGTDPEMNSSIHTAIFKIHRGLVYSFVVELNNVIFLINNTIAYTDY